MNYRNDQQLIDFAKANATASMGDFMPFVELHQYQIDKIYAAGVVKHDVVPEADREWISEMIINPPSPPNHRMPSAETAAKKYIHWKLCTMLKKQFGIPIRSECNLDACTVIHWAFGDVTESSIHRNYKEVERYFSTGT